MASHPILKKRSVLGLAFATAWLLGFASMVSAMPDTRTFDIPADSAEISLKRFSVQSGLQIVFSPEVTEGIRTNEVRGEMKPMEAADRLLSGTNLRLIRDERTGALTVARQSSSVPAGSNSRRATRGKDELVTMDRYEVIGDVFSKNVDMKRSENDSLPFQMISRADIDRSGVTNTTQLSGLLTANSTDANFAGQLSAGNSQAGKATINLRGLGVGDTLVLVNGRRLADSLAFNQQGNFSTIPLDAIDHVEILNSGASAIYGSQAVGGVVNLILRKDYTGSAVTLTYDNTFSTDTALLQGSFISGINSSDRRTNITVYGNLSEQHAIKSVDRGYAAKIRARVLAVRPSLIYNAAPPSSSPGNVRSVSGAPLGIPSNPSANFAAIPASGYNGTGGLAAFNSTAGTYNLNTVFNGGGFVNGASRGDLSDLVDEAKSAAYGLNLYHRFNPHINFFIETLYSLNTQIEPGYAANTFPVVVPASNPYNPFGQAVYVSGNYTDIPNGDYITRNEDYRETGGFEGKINDNWRYIGDFTFELNRLDAYGEPFLQVLPSAPTPSPIGLSDPNLAYNPFLNFSAGQRNSAAAIAAFPYTRYNTYSQYMAQTAIRLFGSIQAPIIKQPVKIAAGFESRHEGTYNNASIERLESTNQLELRNQNGAEYNRTVHSAYAEAQSVLYEPEHSLTLLKEIDLDVGGRTERYTDFGSTSNPIIALGYVPVEGMTIRASYGTGYLAPALTTAAYNQGATPQNANYNLTVTDPKRGNQSLTVPGNGALNPTVRPEKSDSLSIGVIIEPKMIRGLRISADYFRVKKRDNLVTLYGQTLVNNEALFPNLVVRGPIPPGDPYPSGPITQLFFGYINATKLNVEAVDIKADYQVPTAIGDLGFHATSTYTSLYDAQLAINGPLVSELGRPLDYTGAPLRLRGTGGVDLTKNALGLSMFVNYTGHYHAQTGFQDIQGSTWVPSATTVDLQASYDFGRTGIAAERPGALANWLTNLKVTMGVRNIFNKLPPFVADSNYYGYSQFSDPRGANYYVTLKQSF